MAVHVGGQGHDQLQGLLVSTRSLHRNWTVGDGSDGLLAVSRNTAKLVSAKMGLSDEDKAAVFYGTAARVYGIDDPAPSL